MYLPRLVLQSLTQASNKVIQYKKKVSSYRGASGRAGQTSPSPLSSTNFYYLRWKWVSNHKRLTGRNLRRCKQTYQTILTRKVLGLREIELALWVGEVNRVDLRNEEGIGILGLTRQGASPRRGLVADLKALQPFMAAKLARGDFLARVYTYIYSKLINWYVWRLI